MISQNNADSRRLRAAELLYHTELRKFPSIKNTSFLDSFLAIGDFFRRMESDDGLLFTAEYPILDSLAGLGGLDYVVQYLEGYHYENQFLRLFEPSAVQRCLSLYAALIGTTVRELRCNLCEIVLACGLRSIEYGKIASKDCNFEIAAAALLGRMGCTSEGLNRYIARACRTHRLRLWEIQATMMLGTAQVGKDVDSKQE